MSEWLHFIYEVRRLGELRALGDITSFELKIDDIYIYLFLKKNNYSSVMYHNGQIKVLYSGNDIKELRKIILKSKL